MRITVTPADFIIAGSVGMRRAIDCMRQGYERTGGNSHPQDPIFDQAVLGAVAEFIVARMLNLFWDPKTSEHSKGDVGGFIEVRCRNPVSGDELGIKRGELSTTTPYVCVVWRGYFDFDIDGWVYGIEGQERGAWNETRKCFFVPRPYRTMQELGELIVKRVTA